MAKTYCRKIDFDKLESLCLKRGYSLRQLSYEIGFNNNYLANSKKRGQVSIPAVKLICAHFGIDEEYLDVKPKKDNRENKQENKQENSVIFEVLLDRIKSLENRIENIEKKKNIELTEQENILLLLKYMTKYGQCEDALFRQKAKSEGFKEEIIQFALSRCSKELINGKVWIKLKRMK